MKTTNLMMDRPSTRAIIGAASYGLFSFVILPFFLYILMLGSYDDLGLLAGGQMVYHLCNFIAMVCLFAGYLRDSFLNVQVYTSKVATTVASSAAVILAIFVAWHSVAAFTGSEFVYMIAWGTLPVPEMDILTYSQTVAYEFPLLGSLVMVLLVPVTISCIYYAMAFAPICCNKPWLAYIVVAVIIAIPRVISGTLFWSAEQELALYIAQLPIHLVACRAYQKCDTVWAPIFTLMVANLFACVYMGLPSLLLGMLQ